MTLLEIIIKCFTNDENWKQRFSISSYILFKQKIYLRINLSS
jgi:hypothetical protein